MGRHNFLCKVESLLQSCFFVCLYLYYAINYLVHKLRRRYFLNGVVFYLILMLFVIIKEDIVSPRFLVA